jgi:peptide/nickel transport system substrate-binding protein
VNFASLNTAVAPFDNVDVRRAVVAGFDRAAVLSAAGGQLAGTLATHFIPPGVPGFQEAGGAGTPTSPLYRRPHGDLRLAARYLRQAGFRSGRYTGRRPLRLVTSNDTTSQSIKDVAARSLRRLGFRVTVDAVPFDRMLARCSDRTSRIHMCPALGWYRDFPDPQTVIDPLFNGANIRKSGNNNWSQLDVPALNQAIEGAKAIVDPQQRAQAWGALDRRIVDLAPAVALAYPKVAVLRSANVVGQLNTLVGGTWDLPFTALR